jgi:heat-inducible transcriptional repressor
MIFGVSPATVRNDMAALEEEGYIMQPAHSAGRIPTDKGYRLFVDRLGSLKPLSVAEQRAIQTFLSGALDLDGRIASYRPAAGPGSLSKSRSSNIPTLSHSVVRHVEIVSMSQSRLLLILITSTGQNSSSEHSRSRNLMKRRLAGCVRISTRPRSGIARRRLRFG